MGAATRTVSRRIVRQRLTINCPPAARSPQPAARRPPRLDTRLDSRWGREAGSSAPTTVAVGEQVDLSALRAAQANDVAKLVEVVQHRIFEVRTTLAKPNGPHRDGATP